MNRKHAVAAGKDRIRSKLQDVKEEKELIISIIENLVAKTNETANSCLEEENQAAFFKNFHQVSQSLESCSEKLFFIRINLLETDEGEEVLQVNRSKESCDEELFKLDASNKATPDMKEQLTTNDATSKNVYSKETLLHLGNKTSVSSDDSYNQVNVVACPASSFYSTLSSSLTNGAFEQNMKFDSYHSAIINDSKRVQEDENQITVGIPSCQKHRTQSYNQKSKQDGHLSNVKDDNSNGLKEMSVKKVVTSTENINDTSNSGNVGLCDEFQSSAQVYHSSFSFGVCDKELAQSTKHSIVKDQLEVDNQSFTSPYKYDKNLESLKCFINVGGQSHMLQTCKKSTNSSPQYATTDSHSCIGDNSQNISQALFSFDIVEEQYHAHTGPDGTERSKPSDPNKQEHLSLFHNRLNQHYFTPSSVCSESSKQLQTDIPEGEQACSLCGSENFLGSSSSLGTPGSWPNASLAADRNLPTPSVPSTACYEQSVHSLASPSSRLKSHPCLPRALDQKPLKLARANERSDFVIRPIRVKTGEPIPVVVSHIVSPSEFWLQPAGTVIEELSHQLQLAGQQYQNNELHPIEIGCYCMAIFPKDYCWYRAVVLDCSLSDEQPNSPNTVTVQYIDYGNKEVVSAAWLRRLNVEFLSVPKQAVQCYLREVKPLFGQWHGSALDQFQKLVLLPFGLRATFYQPVEDNVHPVEISCFVPVLQSYYSIASSLITSGLALRALSEKGNMGTEDHVPVSTAQNAASGFSDMPQHHHFQNRPNLLVSDTSQSSLQNTSDSETDFTPKKNEISRDASAEASGSEDTKQTPLKKKTSCRCVIPEMLLNGDSQSDSTDHSSTGKMFFWNCLVSPAKVQTSEDGFFVALASVVVSPSEFYVHPVTKENSLLDDLREKMAHFYGMKVLKKWPDNSIPLHVGLYFCCRYTLDRYWYRVKLIKVLEKDYYQNTPSTGKRRSSRKLKQPLTPVLVQFIDYGNVEKVYLKDLYPLVEEFRKYPAFVVRCSLAALRPKGIQSMKSEDDVNNALDLQWPEDVGKRMMELMGFKKCLCIQVISTSQTETPRKDTCLNVHVWDTQGSDDILINSVLVEEGLAETDISPISVEDNEKSRARS
ncbi:uncharacterized protein LOC143247631 [Tachypleus tridentatus]|uniref:uncharacterized protein LOC143247631 n=1 Tax=Tachypleus tridentatus TaxID=6853 RepID=UPI003FD3B3F3